MHCAHSNDPQGPYQPVLTWSISTILQDLVGAFEWRTRGGLDEDEDLLDLHDNDLAPPDASDPVLPLGAAVGGAVAHLEGLQLADAAAAVGAHVPLPIHQAPGQRRLGVPAPLAGAAQPRLKRGTGAWLRQERHRPISEGHDVTVVQACYWLASMKNDHRVTDTVIDQICAMMHHLILPKGNLYPASYHMVKAVLDVEASAARTSHICDKCWTVFPHLPPAAYASHTGTICAAEGCGNLRFNVSETGAVTPKRNIYCFDVRETVLDLMDPLLDNLETYKKQRHKAFQDGASYWASPAGQHVDKKTGYKFSNPPPGEIAIPFSMGKHPTHTHVCVASIQCPANS